MTRRHSLRWAALLLLSSCAGVTAARPGPGDAALLRAQADRWDQDIVAKRREAIAANMADDFRQIDGAGTVESKASFLEGLLDPALEIDPYAVEELEVRLYGETALLTGRTRMTGRYAGKPFTSHYRYTDVYVRQGGAWRVVSVQITRLPPADR